MKYPVGPASSYTVFKFLLPFSLNRKPIQQAMICIPGLILTPQIIADAVCAGSATAALKMQLMAATFVAAGIATFLQSTIGLRYFYWKYFKLNRLPVMHGPAAAFFPPIYAYQTRLHCKFGDNDYVDENEWLPRLREVFSLSL